VKFGFRFFKWRIYIRIVANEPYAWINQMVEDAMIYGEGIVRVGPNEFRMPNPLVPEHKQFFGFKVMPDD
jgi:hypothetical protein